MANEAKIIYDTFKFNRTYRSSLRQILLLKYNFTQFSVAAIGNPILFLIFGIFNFGIQWNSMIKTLSIG